MEFLENVLLKEFTTFKIGGPARYFCRVKSIGDLKAAIAFAGVKDLPFFLLGGGSNILMSDEGFSGLVAKMEMRGVEFKEKDEVTIDAVAHSGENWDDFVAETLQRGLYGLENLSGIPGTVGAAPVQNIGAYGAEIKDALQWVEACDKKTGRVMKFLKNECKFGYRDSIFKSNAGSDWIITRVAFRLPKKGKPSIEYRDLKNYFEARKNTHPTLGEVRNAVLEIRSGKFPNLETIGTAGSFFKNPIISEDKFIELKKQFPELPSYPAGKGRVKIPLAWILDNICGLKGLREGNAGVWQNQALVLVNFGEASAGELKSMAERMIKAVKEKTGIEIEPEVEIVG